MNIDISSLTGIIYTKTEKGKEDITHDVIRAVTIRMIEGFKNDFIIRSKKDRKKYELCLKEMDK